MQNHTGAAGGISSFSGEGGDRDSELEQVLLDLGIEPLLAQTPSRIKQARDRGVLGRHGVSRGSEEIPSVDASGRNGWEGADWAPVEAEDAVAAEAMKKVKQMLHIART